MKLIRKKPLHLLFGCGIAVVISPLLLYRIYTGIYEYAYYRDYKTVREIKLRHICPWECNRFEADLPVKFVPEKHDAALRQRLLVAAENRKRFMIFRFADDRIRLMAFPVKRYFLSRDYRPAYYEVTDADATAKLRKLLDTCAEESD